MNQTGRYNTSNACTICYAQFSNDIIVDKKNQPVEGSNSNNNNNSIISCSSRRRKIERCKTHCGHSFCEECIRSSLEVCPPYNSGSCPLCRSYISLSTTTREKTNNTIEPLTVHSPFGQAYVQAVTPRLGLQSMHFNSVNDSFIWFHASNSPCHWLMSTKMACKKYFHNSSFDASVRAFYGEIMWAEGEVGNDGSLQQKQKIRCKNKESIHSHGVSREVGDEQNIGLWKYKIIFSPDFTSIIGGSIERLVSESYNNASINTTVYEERYFDTNVLDNEILPHVPVRVLGDGMEQPQQKVKRGKEEELQYNDKMVIIPHATVVFQTFSAFCHSQGTNSMCYLRYIDLDLNPADPAVKKVPWGTVFVQGISCNLLIIGVASYHFVEPDKAYINYFRAPSNWLLSDGSRPPHKKYFKNVSYDVETQTFKGDISWSPLSFGLHKKWHYEFKFSSDFNLIESGKCYQYMEENSDDYNRVYSFGYIGELRYHRLPVAT